MRSNLLSGTGVLLLSSACAALAVPITTFNQLVVFGDSLSDNGNAAFVLGGTLPGNYAPNAFTDGANTTPKTTGPFGLWIDQFAGKTGLPDPQPFLTNPLSNTNYAVGTAVTGSGSPQDISNQVAAFGASHPQGAPSNALYTIWGGSNDILNGTNNPAGAADSLFSNILTLAAGGAKYFLWIDVAPLGDTPLARAGGPQTVAAFNAASVAFNNEWANDIAKLRAQGIFVIGVDAYGLFTQISASPSTYGFSNITDPAQGMANVDPNTFLFWDVEHPTTAADALVANLAYNDLVASPEPATVGLMLLGLCGVISAGKLRRRKAALQNR